MPPDASELAPAKVNLALHVTGRRPDGYHELDSLVVFARTGDRLSAAPAASLTLALGGPFGGALADDPDNLVLRAARLLGPGRGAAIRLEKHLPVASGIGGGSSDAAAALRLLGRLWEMPAPDAAAVLGLGADVPVCLAARAARMRGIGDRLDPVVLPEVALVLVNPRVPVPTGAVFAGLARTDNPPMPAVPQLPHAGALARFLAAQRNDLEAPARAIAPVLPAVIDAIAAQPGCLLARMSGSGATCFGLFAAEAEAEAAAAAIARVQPGWWVAAG